MALRGIDISSWQAPLDLNNISYDFVLIKATQGVTYVNPSCDVHYQEAKAAGKKRAVYHFTDFGDPVVEANYCADNTTGYYHDTMIVLDWEGAGVADVGKALAFLQQLESRIGYKPAIYMSEWVENNYDWSAVVAGNYGLWIAKYSDYEIDNNYDMSGAGQPPALVHWPFYFMWQWTSRGHLDGYAGDLDCDIFYGDGASWDAYAGIQTAPEPVVTPPVVAVPDPTPVVEPPVVTVDPVPPLQPTPPVTPVIPDPILVPEPQPVVVSTPEPNWLVAFFKFIVQLLVKPFKKKK